MLSKIKLHNIFEAIYFENCACLYLIIPIKSIPWCCSGNILTIYSEFNKRELHRVSAWFLSCVWTEKNLNNFVFTHAADDYALQTRSFEIANRVNILVLQYNGDKTFVDRPFHYYRLRICLRPTTLSQLHRTRCVVCFAFFDPITSINILLEGK